MDYITVLASVCKDLRMLDENLADKALCAYAAVTDEEFPQVDLSYSYIMRKLRKDDAERCKKFQKVFKKTFDAALYNELENPDIIALTIALKAIDFKREDAK